MNTYAQKEQKASSEKDKTGIPAQMKAKFERSSGFSFDDVRVHYNSEKPAQLHAHAYTQGSEVFVAPGQEKHLPHELGHVVQQKSNAVKPTGEIGGMPLNDDETMEDGADKLAEEAEESEDSDEVPLQAKAKDGGVIQKADLHSEESYNFNAGFMTSVISGLGLAGAIGGAFYTKHSTRKHKYTEEVEKYADAACDAQEEQIALGYNNVSEALIPAKTKGKLKMLDQKIRRNYEAALSKAHAMGEFEDAGKVRRALSVVKEIEPSGEPPKANDNINLDKVSNENVKAALKRAKNAYDNRWKPMQRPIHRPPDHSEDDSDSDDSDSSIVIRPRGIHSFSGFKRKMSMEESESDTFEDESSSNSSKPIKKDSGEDERLESDKV